MFADVWREETLTILPITLDFVNDFRRNSQKCQRSLHRWSPDLLCGQGVREQLQARGPGP